MTQEWRPTWICPGAPSVQHLHLWPVKHHLQRVCICWRSSNHLCWWRLAGSGMGAEQGHGNTRWIPPDLEVKAQLHQNGVGSLLSQQQGNQWWVESQLQQRNPALPLRDQIPQSNVGQVAHLPPTPWVTLQEANITRRTLEVACWLWLGYWSNNVAISHPSLGSFDSRVLSPVWCRSAHTRLIDPTINDTLRIVTGCLRPTPADNLPILAGIQPAELRCWGDSLSLGRCAMEPGHLLHSALTRSSGAAA